MTDDPGPAEPRPSEPARSTAITLVGGDRLLVQGDVHQVEARIVGAARGSIMELAWMNEARSGEEIGVNPEHVIMIRAWYDHRPDRA